MANKSTFAPFFGPHSAMAVSKIMPDKISLNYFTVIQSSREKVLELIFRVVGTTFRISLPCRGLFLVYGWSVKGLLESR